VKVAGCESQELKDRYNPPESLIRLEVTNVAGGHVDNLWLLGGEIIRDLNYDPSRKKVPAQRLLRDAVHPDGGPLIHNGSVEEQRSFDSTLMWRR
jgi:hypothetical protein